MEPIATKPNPTKVATKWALIGIVTGIILTYVYQFANLDQASPVRYISWIPFIAFLLLSQKEFKDQLGGYMKFGEGFSAGFRYSVFYGLLIGVFIYVYYAFLSPDMYAKLLEAQREAMQAKGMTSDQVDQGMSMMNKMGLPIIAFSAAIGSAIFGLIIALIGAAIFKKERSAFDPEPTDVTDATA